MQLIITMSARYKFIDNEGVYFTTSTIAGWTDACLNGTVRFLQEKYTKQPTGAGLRPVSSLLLFYKFCTASKNKYHFTKPILPF